MQNLSLRNRIRKQSGFSLIEMLIVLALIALIVGLVVTNLNRILGGSNEKIAKAFIENLKTPLMAYRLDIGDYPSTSEGLQALRSAPSGKERRWKGPYLEKLPQDPWNHPYQYAYPGVHNPDGYDAWSTGSGQGEEIGNWSEE